MVTISPPFVINDLCDPVEVDGLGKKAANLAAVATIPGARTPKGFALPGAVVDRYLENFRPAILSAVQTFPPNDAHQVIEQLMLASPLDFGGELVAHIHANFAADTLFAVRSSAHPVVNGQQIAEDSEETSLAGQYSTFLRVPAVRVPEALTRCCASLYNPRSIEIFKPRSDTTYVGSTMTVLVQEMIEATASGVMMTVDPLAIAEGIELIGLEASYGPCEAIVSGKTQGDLFMVSRDSLEVVESELGSKRWRSDLPIYGEPTEDRCTVPETERAVFALSHEEARQVAALGLKIERLFGMPQDVEFVLDYNREVVITQARPITTLKERNSV